MTGPAVALGSARTDGLQRVIYHRSSVLPPLSVTRSRPHMQSPPYGVACAPVCESGAEGTRMKQLLCALVLALAFAAGATAQSYPNRPIRLISPNPAGGANDVIGRIVAQK